MLDGVGLDPWGQLPVLRRMRVLGLLLRADRTGRAAYRELLGDAAFRSPLRWDKARAADYDALVLPGGHRARGMRAYLGSSVLQRQTADFFAAAKPVAAICHGVVLAARSKGSDGRSVLHGRRVTALTWTQERTADRLAKVGRWWDRGYYRTYTEAADQPVGYMSVEQEVTRALGADGKFVHVPADIPDWKRKISGVHRDTTDDHRPSWIVRDGNFVSARWRGDAHALASKLHEMLIAREHGATAYQLSPSLPA